MVLFPDDVFDQILQYCLDVAKLEWMNRRRSEIQRICDRYESTFKGHPCMKHWFGRNSASVWDVRPTSVGRLIKK